MSCAACGRAVSAEARYCPGCGAPVSSGGGSVSAPPPRADSSEPGRFEIVGDVMQAVVVELATGQEVQAEAGAMLYMTGGVEMSTGLRGGLLGGLRRLVAGESLFMTRFRGPGRVAFAAPYPGKIQRLDLDGSVAWLCQRDSFLCATSGIDIGVAFTRRLGAGFFGGEGFILQKLRGRGTTFIHAGGNLVELALAPAETLRVDTGCIVAFEQSVGYDIQFVGGFKNALFGGEGLFLATLGGPGKCLLQTLPFSRLVGRILGATREGTGGVAGVKGTLRDLGNILGGDQ
jgi:uncharacterized protein (TIGR00266 family)